MRPASALHAIQGLLLSVALCVIPSTGAAGGAGYVPDEVLVKFRDQASVLGVRQVLTARPGLAPNTRGYSRVAVRPGETVEQVIVELNALPDVELAEPNYIRYVQRTPNDAEFSQQWALRNTGQVVNVGAAGSQSGSADISATQAWDITTGSRDIVVAVIDTGIDLDNLEFVGNLWSGPAGERGHDYVDDDRTPQDVHGHGTSIAGVVGARADNQRGIAGVAWEVSLMSVRAFDARGAGDSDRIADAVDYAIENGARVINASFGSEQPSTRELEAFQRANAAGVLIVAAACNSGADNDTAGDGQNGSCYPASYDLPNIISVAATDNTDALLASSNYGLRTVDLAAPGVGILSLDISDPEDISETLLVRDSGTSIAAAFVTGTAALLLARNPGLDVPGLRAAILDNVDPARNLNGRVASGGRLNAFEALLSVPAGGTQSTGSVPTVSSGGGGGGFGPYTLFALMLWHRARRGRVFPQNRAAMNPGGA